MHFKKLADHVDHLIHLSDLLPRSLLCCRKLVLGHHRDVVKASHQLLPFAPLARRAILLAFRYRVSLKALKFASK